MSDPYPDTPGFKGNDGTSEAAATIMAASVSRLRRIAMLALHKLGSATPLEAIAITGLTREALQPRFSELRNIGLVEATGTRRQNPSGKWAAVLRLTARGRAML